MTAKYFYRCCIVPTQETEDYKGGTRGKKMKVKYEPESTARKELKKKMLRKIFRKKVNTT